MPRLPIPAERSWKSRTACSPAAFKPLNGPSRTCALWHRRIRHQIGADTALHFSEFRAPAASPRPPPACTRWREELRNLNQRLRDDSSHEANVCPPRPAIKSTFKFVIPAARSRLQVLPRPLSRGYAIVHGRVRLAVDERLHAQAHAIHARGCTMALRVASASCPWRALHRNFRIRVEIEFCANRRRRVAPASSGASSDGVPPPRYTVSTRRGSSAPRLFRTRLLAPARSAMTRST
jgi:hypothetical protein